ncbi:MAG: prolipoprotein diacylglyceryl transferase [Syntrophorhabdaceae bacterium]|nr:prolipoprotein diacylglyceryl transferase [Syntrophorhabdaceae bacterium]
MIPYPLIDPVLIKIGPFAVRWYGLMYIFGFLSSYLLTIYQMKKKAYKFGRAPIEDLYFYLIIGLIVGARLGYVLFYNLHYYIERPLEIFEVWKGGMSFHGGLIGTFIIGYIVIKRKGLDFITVLDLIIPTCPPGLAFGRLGNFINGELYGKPTDLPWAVIFPGGGNVPRHPSQLYEALLEGVVLFIILWFYKDRKKREGDVSAMFLMLYGIFRFFCEFFREPDVQIGYVFNLITMGQLLSGAMVLAGIFLKFYYLPKKGNVYH